MANSFFLFFITFFCFTIFVEMGDESMGQFQEITFSSDTTKDLISEAAVHYKTYCAGCHGEYMKSFADQQYAKNQDRDDLFKAIKYGYPDDGMPSFDSTFDDTQINSLVRYIEKAMEDVAQYDFDKSKFNPKDVFEGAGLQFTLEKITNNEKEMLNMSVL